MINKKIKVGSTLSQRGLALRSNYDVSTIRRRGELVKILINGEKIAWRETWKRKTFLNGAPNGYVLVEIEE